MAHYSCTTCLYSTTRKSNFEHHLQSGKHWMKTQEEEAQQQEAQQQEAQQQEAQQQETVDVRIDVPLPAPVPASLSDDKDDDDDDELDKKTLKQLIIKIVVSNTDLQRQCFEMQKNFMEVCQKLQTPSPALALTNNNTNNSHNNNHKTFNMQVFLNEHCKDAMNLTEFVDSIDLQLDDLEMVGKAGFVDGIANIINTKLRATEVHLRPIHCSDAKREVMYIKENNKWEKDGPKNENMHKFVQFIERKNIKLLSDYQDKYPESRDYESPLNDHYVQLSMTATSATPEHLDRVVSKIAKEVLIDK